MKSLILTVILALTSFGATAATKYVRPDGGTATQCTGLANAAYDGAGTGEACAYKNPSYALGMRNQTSRIAGGDTVIIANGTYGIGYGTDGDQAGCTDSNWTDGCYVLPIPSGSSGSPTRLLGEGYATGCKVKPKIYGVGAIGAVLSLSGSDWVDVSCLEISDNSVCVNGHPLGACPTAPPFLPYAQNGIYAADSDNVNLTDINIHGLAANGINAGRLSNWVLTRVRLAANGWAGWDGNVGVGVSSNTGTMTFRSVEIAWNGCTEDYPTLNIIRCWGESSGGYGDGLGTHTTAGTWLFEDSWIHHNTSDGLDMLYLGPTNLITVQRTRLYANGGQQLKVSGNATIESNYLSGHCSYFAGRFGAYMPAGDSCRASGNTISVNVANVTGVTGVIRYNTITGQGDNQILLRTEGEATPNAIINIENNVVYGHQDWLAGDQSGGVFLLNATPTVNYRSNSFYNLKSAFCPATSTCTDPMLNNTTLATFDPRPTAASYLRNSGNTTYPTPSKDVTGRNRPTETTPTRGAFEYVPLP